MKGSGFIQMQVQATTNKFCNDWSIPKFSFLLIALFFLSHPSWSQSKDTLFFYNKTKIVGELLQIELGRIEFDADNIGVVKIKNSKVESIHATSRSFRIETLQGHELQGYLMRSDNPGRVVVNAIVESEEIPIIDIVNLVYYGKTLKSRFDGNISAGYTYTKSSEIGRFNSEGLFKYNTSKGQTRVTGDMIFTSDSVKAYTERANLSFGHEHNIGALWSAIGILKYQQNLELGLKRRWQEAAGIGKEFLINKNQQAIAMAGIAFNQEINLEGASLNTTEAMFQATYDLFSFSNPNMSISFVESVFTSLTGSSRVRLDGNISFNYEIISDFSINFQFYHN
ncbi:MAG TPA: DUF481 domain-containing protein, partial [Cyclobacteriaceae bacterium]